MATSEPPQVLTHQGRVYSLASDYSPAQIAAVVETEGSFTAGAAKLGLDEELVQAAVDAHRRGATAAQAPAGAVTTLKDALGAIAGLGGLAFLLGGLVLYARLSFFDLPGQAVFGQLPRDFLLTVGVGQVLVPGLVVALLHTGLRVLRRDAPLNSRGVVVVAVAIAWLAAVVGVLTLRAHSNAGIAAPTISGEDAEFWVITLVSLTLVIAAAAYVRWKFSAGRFHWKRGPRWISLTLVYGFAAMIAATAIVATYPLLEARACMSTGFARNGDLVGQSENRIFLGGDIEPRLILSLPTAEVDELFIGDRARETTCRGRPPGEQSPPAEPGK